MIFLPLQGLAQSCAALKGQWQGEWQDQHHHRFRAILNISTVNQHTFLGNYSLSDHSQGSFQGICKHLATSEFLTLRKDPPWYNPCYGTMIKMNKNALLHFYCFKPNQFGYFKRL